MRFPILALLVLVTATAGASDRRSVFANQSRPLKARVVIQAVSSTSRQSFAGNQDIYIADVQLKDGKHEFARLIDQYPGFGLPIRGAILRQRPALEMKVTREPECDVPGRQVYLATGSTVYDASVRETLAGKGDDVIPCFRTLHQTIRLAKK